MDFSFTLSKLKQLSHKITNKHIKKTVSIKNPNNTVTFFLQEIKAECHTFVVLY